MSYYRLSRSVPIALFGCAGMLAALSAPVWALPTGAESISGNVQFNQNGNTLDVTTNASRSIAQYQTFNINHGETVNFNLPSASSAILNRVVGGSPSEIMGALNSNGHVFLVNPSGIIFGSTAQVNVGSLTASTLGISNQNFLNGQLTFSNPGSGSIENNGTITVTPGGAVNMLSSAIVNNGTINAPLGSVNLAVGDQVTLTSPDGIAVQATVDDKLHAKLENYQEAILNTGTLSANGGNIALQADLVKDLYLRAVNNEGHIEANSVVDHNGSISLVAHAEDTTGGLIRNNGVIEANGGAGLSGGTVLLDGDYLSNRNTIRAEGQNGGAVTMLATQNINLIPDSLVSVKSNQLLGNGGSIRVRAEKDTTFYTGARLNADAGDDGGNGGSVSVSGIRSLLYAGTATASAPNGTGGQLSIDPATINLVAAAASIVPPNNANGTPDVAYADSPGGTVSLDVRAGGSFTGFSEIFLQATTAINVTDAFNLDVATGGTATRLILDTYTNINVNAPITNGSLSNLDIQLLANNDNGGAGSVTFGAAGAITLSQPGTISIQGSDLNMAAGSSINAGGGTLRITPFEFSGAKTITLGADVGGTFSVDTNELSQISNVGTLTFGGTRSDTSNYAGQINVNGTPNSTATTTNLTTTGGFAVTAGNSLEGNTININTGGNVNVSGAITSTNNAVNINASGTGNVTINSNINAGTGTVSITNTTDITRTAGTVTGSSVTLGTSGSIGGSGTEVQTAAGTLSASTAGGNVSVINSGAVILAGSNNAGGTYTLTTTGTNANITINNGITANIINLTANGSILDGNALGTASPDVSANFSATLLATGLIGTIANPLEIKANNGLMTLRALGTEASNEVSNRSFTVLGSVSPVNSLTVQNTTPGAGFFNGVCVYGNCTARATASSPSPAPAPDVTPNTTYLFTSSNDSSNPSTQENTTLNNNQTNTNTMQNDTSALVDGPSGDNCAESQCSLSEIVSGDPSQPTAEINPTPTPSPSPTPSPTAAPSPAPTPSSSYASHDRFIHRARHRIHLTSPSPR